MKTNIIRFPAINTNEVKLPQCEFLKPDVFAFIHNILIDAPKITRRPTKRNFQDAYIYAIRQDVDGEFPYETEITHKMAGWLNMNGFDVDFDEIKRFVENPKHF